MHRVVFRVLNVNFIFKINFNSFNSLDYSVNVYSRDGAFLYKIKLNDLSTNFDPADQPIRIFQKSPNTDHVLLVIERENNLLPVRFLFILVFFKYFF